MAYQVELTDTFGGEANYSWVRRAVIPAPTKEWGSRAYRQALMRAAKASVGATGDKGRTSAHGHDDLTWRPYGACVVMFVTWTDEEPSSDD